MSEIIHCEHLINMLAQLRDRFVAFVDGLALPAQLDRAQDGDPLAQRGGLRVDHIEFPVGIGFLQHSLCDLGGMIGAADAGGHPDIKHVYSLLGIGRDRVIIGLGGDLRGVIERTLANFAIIRFSVKILNVHALHQTAGIILRIIGKRYLQHIRLFEDAQGKVAGSIGKYFEAHRTFSIFSVCPCQPMVRYKRKLLCLQQSQRAYHMQFPAKSHATSRSFLSTTAGIRFYWQ